MALSTRRFFTTRLALLGVFASLGGCASLPSLPNVFGRRPAPAPSRSGRAQSGAGSSAAASSTTSSTSNSQSAYDEGLRLYRQGQYQAALEQFATVQSPRSLQLQALKYSAFSQCVTNQLAACEQSFAQALSISPGFRLSQTEQGHPVWGPVFAKVLARQRGS